MHSGPPKALEAVIALLIPPACREEVLGDLHERYSSPRQYSRDALGTVPLVIASRMRRTADPRMSLMQALVLYVSFLGAAWLRNGSYLQDGQGLLRLALPAGMTLLALLLADTYAKPERRPPLTLIRAPVLGPVFSILAQGALRLVSPNLTVPLTILLYGGTAGLLLTSTVRMLFAQRQDGVA